MADLPRMRSRCASTNPWEGRVVWSPVKSLWFTGMATVALIAGPLTFTWAAGWVACGLTVLTLCLGHTVGLHRLLIHRSFACPRWLEYTLVYLGMLVGMAGPRRVVYMHDIRDWSQRHPRCHRFFIHAAPIWLDWFWQMHCEMRLTHPPRYLPNAPITAPRFYRFLDRTWMLQQLPLAAILFWLGGWPWVVWGIAVRVTISLTGHWLVGYIAHNWGRQPRIVEGAAVQGRNVNGLGLLTMGEAWHNNHHAFPESARLGLTAWQSDPGWWAIALLRRLGLAWNVRLPENLPPRRELRPTAMHHDCQREGTLLLSPGVHSQPLVAFEQSGILDEVSRENFLGNIEDTLNRARLHLDLPPVARSGPFTPTVRREALPQDRDL